MFCGIDLNAQCLADFFDRHSFKVAEHERGALVAAETLHGRGHVLLQLGAEQKTVWLRIGRWNLALALFVAVVNGEVGAMLVVPAAIASASKDRLLLVVVSDHLDSSERMLLEISNADAKHPLDVASQSKRAGELVASNRIYRQTAARRGETRIASLLSDLEPVLVELSHAGSTLSPDEIAALQKRIDSKGLLFKVRVVSAQVGGHEAPATVPQKGIDSL